MVGVILWALIGGAIIGIPLWATVLCGVGGIFLGNWLYVDVFDFKGSTSGLDWWRHLWQVAVAAILVIAAASVVGRRTRY
jgi:hypothetical protein